MAQQVYVVSRNIITGFLDPTAFLPIDNFSEGDVVIYREDALRSIQSDDRLKHSQLWIIIEIKQENGAYVLANHDFQGAFRVTRFDKITIFKRNMKNANNVS